MTRHPSQLALDLGLQTSVAIRPEPARVEPRETLTRLVEYAPVPRINAEQRPRVAITRDLSASGLCLAANGAEPIGSLLRVVVRTVDGRPAVDALARVAWCAGNDDGLWTIGLTLVGETRPARAGMRFVRRLDPARRLALA